MMAGAAVLLTHRAIDTDAITGISPGGVPGGGLLPAYATGQQDGDTNYLGTEVFGEVTWRFAPGLSWGNAAGYMFTGEGFDAFTLAGGPRNAKDIFIMHVPPALHVLARASCCRGGPGGNSGPVVVPQRVRSVAVGTSRGV